MLGALGCAATGDEADIAALRQSSNDAIARHDTAGIGAIWAESVVVVTSNSLRAIGRAANLQRFADQFRTRPDVVYERRPVSVDVFAPWQMAAESGVWTGSWTDTDGPINLRGVYFVKWRRIGGAWRVESETYVPQSCTGGSYCSRIP
jgi:ketosteroid isomerase-like protein